MAITTVMLNARDLLKKLVAGTQYTFTELLSICNYTPTDLCLALLYLIREGKMRQYRLQGVVYQPIV